MTPADVARLVQRHGETVMLRREGTPSVDVTLKARVTGFDPTELVGDIRQGDRRVTISNAEILSAGWPAPIKLNDRVIIAGKIFTVMAVDTRKLGDEIAGHWLLVRGSN